MKETSAGASSSSPSPLPSPPLLFLSAAAAAAAAAHSSLLLSLLPAHCCLLTAAAARCTGYRPILDSAKTFSTSSQCSGHQDSPACRLGALVDIEELVDETEGAQEQETQLERWRDHHLKTAASGTQQGNCYVSTSGDKKAKHPAQCTPHGTHRSRGSTGNKGSGGGDGSDSGGGTGGWAFPDELKGRVKGPLLTSGAWLWIWIHRRRKGFSCSEPV